MANEKDPITEKFEAVGFSIVLTEEGRMGTGEIVLRLKIKTEAGEVTLEILQQSTSPDANFRALAQVVSGIACFPRQQAFIAQAKTAITNVGYWKTAIDHENNITEVEKFIARFAPNRY